MSPTIFTSKLKQLRWYQWLLFALLLIYLMYIALAYLYLPNKLKWLVQHDVAQMIGREINVEKFEYNPFLLSLRVGEFSIADGLDRPLLGWKQLYLDFGFWKSLFGLKIGLQEVQLDQPQINIEKQGERFNFTDILEKLDAMAAAESESEEEAQSDGSGIALEISRTVINHGEFRFADFSGATPAHSTLNDITIEVQDIYLATGEDQLNPYDIKAIFPGGGDLQLSGKYRLHPLHVESELQAREIQLSTFSDFLYNIIPLRLSNGLLSLRTDLLVEQKQQLDILISNGQLGLKALKLDDAFADPTLFKISALDIKGINVDVFKQSVSIDEISVDDVTGNLWLDKEGKPRYEPLLAKRIAEENVEYHERDLENQSQNPDESFPWDILVKQAALQSGTLNFSDQNEKINQSHEISEMSLNVTNFTFDKEKKVVANFSALVDQSGKINTDVSMTLLPFEMDLNYQLDDMKLAPFSEYVETLTYLRIEKGALDLKGNVQFSNEETLPFIIKALAEVDGFQAEDTRTGKPVIAFTRFSVGDVAVNSSEQSIHIGTVQLDKPDLRVVRSEQSELNLATLSKPQAPGSKTTDNGSADLESDSEQKQGSWSYAVDKLVVNEGTTKFSDYSLKPAFTIGIYDMNLGLDKIDSSQQSPIPFTFTSKIDKYAPFNVKGKLAPLDKQPGFQFTSNLNGLEMTGLSPYTGVYIGNNLRSGDLSLALNYSLENRKLNGKNQVVAKNLYLGDKVASEQAINAPVALGLALLRDLDGVIDLDVGVSGDLDDPGFSVAGVVMKALVNVIVKAAASPFKLLGSIAGGGEDMGQIEFDPGMASLTGASQERLRQLTGALQQKPSLSLTVVGNAAEQSDKEMLQKLMVQDAVARERKISLDELREEAKDEDWWTVRGNRKALNLMAVALGLPSDSDKEQQLKEQQPELKGDDLDAAVYQAVYMDVAHRQKIDTSNLLSLADQRAIAIKQYLVNDLQFDHERVAVEKASAKQLTGNVVNLQLGAR